MGQIPLPWQRATFVDPTANGISICVPRTGASPPDQPSSARFLLSMPPHARAFSRPIPHLDCILFQRCNGIVGVDIAWGTLQEKTERFFAECPLYGLGHHARIVSGVLKVIASKNDWMTRVVDQDGKRSPIRLVDTQHRDNRIHRRGRYLGKIPFKPV